MTLRPSKAKLLLLLALLFFFNLNKAEATCTTNHGCCNGAYKYYSSANHDCCKNNTNGTCSVCGICAPSNCCGGSANSNGCIGSSKVCYTTNGCGTVCAGTPELPGPPLARYLLWVLAVALPLLALRKRTPTQPA